MDVVVEGEPGAGPNPPEGKAEEPSRSASLAMDSLAVRTSSCGVFGFALNRNDMQRNVVVVAEKRVRAGPSRRKQRFDFLSYR